MVRFPNAKINLGLNILSKRTDGFHDIESIFYPVAWCDALEILPATEFSFKSTGLAIPGNPDNNLITKAYQKLKDRIKPCTIHLHKCIPMGAGIGGGSADAAFAISMLNDLFKLKLAIEEQESIAAELGSDCPFFIQNIPKLCTGRGTDMHAIDFSMRGKFIVLINPGIHISTQEAYSMIVPKKPQKSIVNIVKQPINTWKSELENDFEKGCTQLHPLIHELKMSMYEHGALYASMTGSGSTVYGIFEETVSIKGYDQLPQWSGIATF